MKWLKYIFYLVLFLAIYQFIDDVSTGKIQPMDKIKNMSDNLTQMTEKVIQATYQNTMAKMSDNIDQSIDNGENVMKQIINE